MKELFSNFAASAITKPVLMIAMTPRTGSTWLCAEFAIAIRGGQIMEIFNSRGPIQWSGCWRPGTSFGRYMAALARRRAPVFVFKTAWMDFQHIAHIAGDLFPNLQVAYLRRRNIDAQALSLYHAHTTGRWHSDRDGVGRSEAFNPNLAREVLQTIESELAGWDAFFAANGLHPMELYYEDFQSDPRPAIFSLASLIGLNARPQFCRSPLRQLGVEDDPLMHEIAQLRSRDSASGLP